MRNIPTRKDLIVGTCRLFGLTCASGLLFVIVTPLILSVLILWPFWKLFEILTKLSPWCMDDTTIGYTQRFLFSLKSSIFYREWKRQVEGK